MPSIAPHRQALCRIQALCSSGWPAEWLLPQLLRALHGLVPSARNLFDVTDAEGRLLHYFFEGPIDTALAQHYFEHFHNLREAECMPLFASLRQLPASVRSAAELDNPGFFSSDLYNEVWRPQGLHTRLEGVLRGRSGRLLGSLVLYRGPGERAFNRQDEQRLAALLPTIAAALERSAPASGANHAVTGEATDYLPALQQPESLLLDAAGQIQLASPGAAQLAMLADGGISPQALAEPLQQRSTRLFGRLIDTLRARLAAPAATNGKARPSLTICNAHGRFDAQGMLLAALPGTAMPGAGPAPASAGSGHVPSGALLQITLRQLEPRAVALRRVLLDLPITPGQAQVCAALYDGQAQTDIARSTGVAPSTVVDHVRKLYRALDVCSAAELRHRLDGELQRRAA